jgi:hypothetical protein
MISEAVAVFDDVVKHGDDATRCRPTILLAAQAAPDHLHIADGAEHSERQQAKALVREFDCYSRVSIAARTFGGDMGNSVMRCHAGDNRAE